MSTATPVVNTHTRTLAQLAGDLYIGRGSEWGNPFPMRRGAHREDSGSTAAGSRRDVILRYEQHLLQRIIDDPGTTPRLRLLHGRTLRCFCAPRPCHGDVLAHYVDALALTGELPEGPASRLLYPEPGEERTAP